MGALYVVVPLNDDCANWLDGEGVAHPPVSPQYRNPTPAEIEQVLADLPEYTFEIRRSEQKRTWYADISWAQNPSEGPWTEIALREYGNDRTPHEFYFTKGWLEPILLVTEKLSRICGPIAIADDSNAVPYLVRPGMSLQSMIREYNARKGVDAP